LEVLNFGVNGFGTDQAYLRYLRDGAPFHADIVLIGLMAENILRNVSVYRPAYNHGTDTIAVKPRFRLDATGSLELVPCPVRSAEELQKCVQSGELLETLYQTDYWVRRGIEAYQGSLLFKSAMVRAAYAGFERWHPPGRYYRATSGEPFRVTARILHKFHETALRDGAQKAIVLFFPGEGEISETLRGEPPYWMPMTEDLRTAGIPVIDLTAPLAEAVQGEGLSTYYRIGHLSPKGNAVVADTLRGILGGTEDVLMLNTNPKRQ